MPLGVVVRQAAVLAVCLVMSVAIAPSAGADPNSDPAPPTAVPPDGQVPSGDPATVNTPDDWILGLSARDEMQLPVPPLTTAVWSREYIASGTFAGSLIGPEKPEASSRLVMRLAAESTLSTSNGVTMAGSAGITPSLTASGPLGVANDCSAAGCHAGSRRGQRGA